VPSERPRVRFADILENIERIEFYMGEIASFEAFVASSLHQDAIERCLLRICEAAVKLGDVAERLAPEIPWQDVRGMGNHLRHAYDLVDPRILWNTVLYDLPPLKVACRRALRKLQD
jgi:uncharacterized protein with HEPN domain